MEWQQLEYFQTVARMQHMTMAAEALSVSQPALSRSIARLEKELGVPLFERSGRSIALSRYGKLFLERVNRILREYQEGRKELEDLLHPDHGEVSLGFLHTLGYEHIPWLIAEFQQKNPNIQFQLHEHSTPRLLQQLEAGDIDLCMASPRETALRVQWENLWYDELCVIVPKQHRLADSGSILLNEIRDEPFIPFKKGFGMRHITDELCRIAGFEPTIAFQGDEVTTIEGFVAAGLGVAIVPNQKSLNRDAVAVLSVRAPICRRLIGMAWVEGRYLSPAAQKFRQFMIERFRERSARG
ncbi:LysR family transcriptional regulator [Gorillibacterium timonense]|uniref:LysR family transcriptional regulator n=1 Tax=Gorillibacterium timonense TaxID=1689269 RepID=UPI00071C394A|nr:LysR family transcriptional regulator [Gorillibacterium timonense]